MQTYVPSYYAKFSCIASRCRHNCCIGWEIDIDSDTYSKYINIKGEFGALLKQNIIGGKNPRFKMLKGGGCPFLNKDNLCNIIINLGEDSLCEICHLHPRFINYFENRAEVGLGLCCEEAARIILKNKDKVEIECENSTDNTEETSFLKLRKRIFDALQDRAVPIESRIENALSNLGVVYRKPTCKQIYDIYKPLERLESIWDTELDRLLESEQYPLNDFDIIAEQMLVYFVYRHFSESLEDGLFAERLAFAILSYNCIKEICKSYKNISIEKIIDIARMYSSEVEYSGENLREILSKI